MTGRGRGTAKVRAGQGRVEKRGWLIRRKEKWVRRSVGNGEEEEGWVVGKGVYHNACTLESTQTDYSSASQAVNPYRL